jgi:hypothetical protein
LLAKIIFWNCRASIFDIYDFYPYPYTIAHSARGRYAAAAERMLTQVAKLKIKRTLAHS